MLKLPKLSTGQIDQLNIGLMIVSLGLAFFLPFELFLFSYAVLGPLHYLTEISWLHQKKYYVPGKKDYLFFAVTAVVLGFVIFISNYYQDFFGKKSQSNIEDWGTNIILFLFVSAILFVAIKKNTQRFIALGVLVIISLAINFENKCITCTNPNTQQTQTLCETDNKAINSFIRKNGADTDKDGYIDNCQNKMQYAPVVFFFTAYLPTLIHVYIFTMLFMLFGALKSNSKTGIIAVIVLIICGLIPFIWDPSFIPYQISDYAKSSYDVSFLNLNQLIFENFNLGSADPQNIYTSRIGIMLTRFIAFAYTYHYLNWFSKTSIIQWHKMPLINLSVVIILWLGAIALYLTSYKTGLKWLFFLSFLHVFMEFPLNIQSIIGIGRAIFGKKIATA